MTKIGILTFHRALNNGAVLQAYALQKTLEKMNLLSEIIDYRCPKIESSRNIWIPNEKNLLKRILKIILMSPVILLKKNRYNNFISKELTLSHSSYDKNTITKCEQNYNVFITGSDQVWSYVAADFDDVYFLGFANNVKKASYAASIGTSVIPDKYITNYEKMLSGFRYISVRENSAATFISSLINKDVCCHIDPVFLLKEEEWKKLLSPSKYKNGYIVVYTIAKPVKLFYFVKKLQLKTGLKVIYINDYYYNNIKGVKRVIAGSPSTFINLLYHANYVITNSFHGIAFSLIFHKNFFYENSKSTIDVNTRIDNLNELFNIWNCEIIDGDNCAKDNYDLMDWDNVDMVIDRQRNNSIKYLFDIAKE